MPYMSVTLEVSKLVNGWLNAKRLNAESEANINFMSVTWEVLKLVNGWLKVLAP